MKKENELAKLSLRQHPFTGIRTVLCFVLFIGATPASFAHDRNHDKDDHKFYLSLGDSLSVGVQPDANGINQRTDHGYPDQLFNIISAEEDDLRLVKLGCDNRETTENMISGGECSYEEGSQLAQAVKFLRKHGDDVALITIDIGVNDVIFSGCIIETDGIVTGVDVDCILAPDGPFAQVAANLPIILSTLQQAADDDTPIVAMNYYNTFLAAWLTGQEGQVLAEQSVLLADIFNNDVLGQSYAAFGVPVADVAGAFDSNNFTDMVPFPTPDSPFMIPQNVALICLWTYMCVPDPVGPNIHANPTGYGVIAAAFEGVLPAEDDDDYRRGHRHGDRHHDRRRGHRYGDRHHDRPNDGWGHKGYGGHKIDTLSFASST